MIWFAVVAASLALVAICKMVFGLAALRRVPAAQRPEVIRAVGEAWSLWTRW